LLHAARIALVDAESVSAWVRTLSTRPPEREMVVILRILSGVGPCPNEARIIVSMQRRDFGTDGIRGDANTDP